MLPLNPFITLCHNFIFDCDGVLVNSEPFSCAAWFSSLKEFDINLPSNFDFTPLFGLNTKSVVRFFYDRFPEQLKFISPKIIQEKKEEEYYRLSAGNLHVFPGIIEFLNELQNNHFKKIVASSGVPKKIEFNLFQSGLKEWFPQYVSGEEVQFGKPHPDIFLKAAEKLNVLPEECVVFEDALNGIDAAKKAGMFVIGITNTFSADKLKRADIIISSFKCLSFKNNMLIINPK